MPITANAFIGEGSHKLEFGAGIVYAESRISTIFGEGDQSASGVAETIVIGYRYQQSLGGFLFRIGFTPIFRIGGKFFPSGGISIGMSF